MHLRLYCRIEKFLLGVPVGLVSVLFSDKPQSITMHTVKHSIMWDS